ncbi:MAG: radical SAM protein [Pirellulaceae bacterium]|nr:radical SAM protein [Pirellulaceae bacterium]
MTKRLLFETDKRLLWKLFWNMGIKGVRSVQKHKKRLGKGEFFPPYLYISIINSCNLRCQGCWVDVAAKQEKIEFEALDRLITEAKAMGNSFFGLLGGEPFMHPQMLDLLEKHRDVYFQVFTNGHFITDKVAKRIRKMGNVTPLISVEGSEVISDIRRGKEGVYGKSLQGIKNCIENKVMTGVCTSLCQSNYNDLLTEEWIDTLIDLGVMYTWYHIYRPVGPEPSEELALSPEQQLTARQFVVDMRVKKPIVFVDAYYDSQGKALCPAATGFTHHISPWGDIEPCPIIQFSKDSIYDERPVKEVFNESAFLTDFRKVAAESTRGCIVLERPDLLEDLVERHTAQDTTARKKAMAELKAMEKRSSQYNPGHEIPEKSWAYRLAKWFAYHDYGVYKKHFELSNWEDHREKEFASAPQKPDDLVQIKL